MAALRSRYGHYIFALRIFLLSFFPRLISAVAEWMSTILPHIWCGLSANLGCRSETPPIFTFITFIIGPYYSLFGSVRQIKLAIRRELWAHVNIR